MDPPIELREVHLWSLGSPVISPVSPPLIMDSIIKPSSMIASILVIVVRPSLLSVLMAQRPLLFIPIFGPMAIFISRHLIPHILMSSSSARASMVASTMNPSFHGNIIMLYTPTSSQFNSWWLMHRIMQRLSHACLNTIHKSITPLCIIIMPWGLAFYKPSLNSFNTLMCFSSHSLHSSFMLFTITGGSIHSHSKFGHSGVDLT
ncbi:hypothetical protein I3760_05G078500 [Carya illinoinensis]|nr:hypothetical protein I3760_05G078500 [Carya illinoinensis]